MKAGQLIAGRYRIESRLGVGGMGEVWRATHTGTGRDFAIKFMHAHAAASENARQRFSREARASAKINHPNIIDVFDVGSLDDGVLYLVMELLDGVALGDAFHAQPPLSVLDLFAILLDTSQALAAAHAVGIIHRDIKPPNIFLHRDRQTGLAFAKILDFGISKFTGDDVATKTGSILGSPRYMSPEQTRSAAAADARADIWAMGVMMFEGITGTWPHEGDSFSSLVINICTVPPLSIDKMVPNLPESVRGIIRDCLRPYDERIASATELSERIEQTLDDDSLANIPLPRPLHSPGEGFKSTTGIRVRPPASQSQSSSMRLGKPGTLTGTPGPASVSRPGLPAPPPSAPSAPADRPSGWSMPVSQPGPIAPPARVPPPTSGRALPPPQTPPRSLAQPPGSMHGSPGGPMASPPTSMRAPDSELPTLEEAETPEESTHEGSTLSVEAATLAFEPQTLAFDPEPRPSVPGAPPQRMTAAAEAMASIAALPPPAPRKGVTAQMPAQPMTPPAGRAPDGFPRAAPATTPGMGPAAAPTAKMDVPPPARPMQQGDPLVQSVSAMHLEAPPRFNPAREAPATLESMQSPSVATPMSPAPTSNKKLGIAAAVLAATLLAVVVALVATLRGPSGEVASTPPEHGTALPAASGAPPAEPSTPTPAATAATTETARAAEPPARAATSASARADAKEKPEKLEKSEKASPKKKTPPPPPGNKPPKRVQDLGSGL